MSEAYRLFQLGLAKLGDGHADEAIVPLERAKRLEPNSMSILEALGRTYLRVGFYDRAVEAFQTILDREPIDPYAHFCIGRAFDRLGERTEARHHYRLAMFFGPEQRIYRETMRAFMVRAFPEEEWYLADHDDGQIAADG